MTPADQAMGIDVSSHNGHVDWDAVSGVAFALARATTGMSTVDTLFAENWSGMAAADIVRGAYHFYWATSDPVKQAESFARTVTLLDGDLPPVLDLEASVAVAPAALVEGVASFLTRLEQLTGRRPLIYTNPSYWDEMMCHAGPPPWTAQYPLWVSHWTSAAQPTLPRGWTEWKLWQHSSTGAVAGVGGRVDLDVFAGTAADLSAWLAGDV